jgi:hypothetical protein
MKKILIFFAVFALVFVGSAITGVLYVSRHPESLRKPLETVLSKSLGAHVKLGRLAFSRPWTLNALNVELTPGGGLKTVSARIAAIRVGLRFHGLRAAQPFVLDPVQVAGCHIAIDGGFRPGPTGPGGDDVPVPGWIGLGDVSLTGAATFSEGRQVLAFTDISLHRQAGGQLTMVCAAAWQHAGNVAVAADRIQFQGMMSQTGALSGALVVSAAIQLPGIGRSHAQFAAQVNWDAPKAQLEFRSVHLDTGAMVLAGAPEKEFIQNGVSLEIRGGYDTARGQGRIDDWKLTSPGFMTLAGTAGVSNSAFLLNVLQGRIDSAAAVQIARRFSGKPVFPGRCLGALLVGGRLSGRLADKPSQWRCDANLQLKENQLSVQEGDLSVSARANGTLAVSGPLAAPVIDADLILSGSASLAPWLLPTEFCLDGTLQGTWPAFLLPRVDIHVPEAAPIIAGACYPLTALGLAAQGIQFDAALQTFSVPAATLSASRIRPIGLTGKGSAASMTWHLNGDKVGLLPLFAAANFPWQVHGDDGFHIQATIDNTAVHIQSDGLVSNLGLQSPGGIFVGDKLQAKLTSRIDFTKRSRRVKATVGVRAETGEVLAGRFYLNLADSPLVVSGSADADLNDSRLLISDLSVQLGRLLAVTASARMQKTPKGTLNSDVEARLLPVDAAPIFEQLIKDPFKAEAPGLSDVTVLGRLAGQLALSATGAGLTARGHVRLQQADIRKSPSMHLAGIQLDLPLWYETRASQPPKPMTGRIQVASASLAPFPEQPIDIFLEALPNRLESTSRVTLRVPGGRVGLGPVAVANVFGPQPRAQTDLRLFPVSIRALLTRLFPGVLPSDLTGRIQGHLHEVRFAGGRLSSQGQIIADLAGGRVVLSDLGADQVFSPVPVFRADLSFDGLRLADLTTGTTFGQIQGVLRGRILGLEIAHGQPQKFSLSLETVKTPGVAQRISVSAVDNIARIGGGQSPFMGLAGSFAAFFRDFPYRRIGIEATLQNDRFRINGTIRENGKEYLVKRGGLTGVDIVNLNPDNRISFKDMLGRLQRITKGSAGAVVE